MRGGTTVERAIAALIPLLAAALAWTAAHIPWTPAPKEAPGQLSRHNQQAEQK